MNIEQGTLSLFGWQDHQLPDLPRGHSHPEHRRLLEISLLCEIPMSNVISHISMAIGTRNPPRSSKLIPTRANFNGYGKSHSKSPPRFLGLPFPWKSSHNSPRYRHSPDLSSFGSTRGSSPESLDATPGPDTRNHQQMINVHNAWGQIRFLMGTWRV